MKRAASFIFAVLMTFSLRAEHCPSKWIKFTLGDYVYDIQTSKRTDEFNNEQLLNICRANVAKQIEVKVYDNATLQKLSTNGHVNITYTTQTDYTTDVELKFLKTESFYDSHAKRTYAIAYINKVEASNYYYQQILLLYEKIKSSLTITDYLIQNEELIKAGEEIKKAKEDLIQSEENYNLLTIFGCNKNTINTLLSQRAELSLKIEQKQSYLSTQPKTIYIQCEGMIFDMSCKAIEDTIKSNLSELSCSFTDNSSQADWIIKIKTDAISQRNSRECFVHLSITAIISNTSKHTTYTISKNERDSAQSVQRAAEIILNRGVLLRNITSEIINLLKSK